MLQARMFAYGDAARYRLGANYQQLPTNAAYSPVYCPFQRDGAMNFSSNYGDDPSYVGSSLRPTEFATSSRTQSGRVASTITEHEKWVGQTCSFASSTDEQDFEQATALWKVLEREPGHQERYIDNVAEDLKYVVSEELRAEVYCMWCFLKNNRLFGLPTCMYLQPCLAGLICNSVLPSRMPPRPNLREKTLLARLIL